MVPEKNPDVVTIRGPNESAEALPVIDMAARAASSVTFFMVPPGRSNDGGAPFACPEERRLGARGAGLPGGHASVPSPFVGEPAPRQQRREATISYPTKITVQALLGGPRTDSDRRSSSHIA